MGATPRRRPPWAARCSLRWLCVGTMRRRCASLSSWSATACRPDERTTATTQPCFQQQRLGTFRSANSCSGRAATQGADLNAADSHGHTPVFWAAHDDRVNMMKFLVEKGADPKILAKNGKSLLFSATGGAAAYALQLGCNPQQQDQLGQTPIFRAAKDPRKVKLLVENGAYVDAQDKNWADMSL
ncbi:unnamed protein product [Effrenium voratum]|nr:unnamed protein product [Effrenium voratum]